MAKPVSSKQVDEASLLAEPIDMVEVRGASYGLAQVGEGMGGRHDAAAIPVGICCVNFSFELVFRRDERVILITEAS